MSQLMWPGTDFDYWSWTHVVAEREWKLLRVTKSQNPPSPLSCAAAGNRCSRPFSRTCPSFEEGTWLTSQETAFGSVFISVFEKIGGRKGHVSAKSRRDSDPETRSSNRVECFKFLWNLQAQKRKLKCILKGGKVCRSHRTRPTSSVPLSLSLPLSVRLEGELGSKWPFGG